MQNVIIAHGVNNVAIVAIIVVILLAAGLISITFQPVLYNLAFLTDFWMDTANVHDDLEITRDNIYNVSIGIPIIVVMLVGLWAYITATRRDDGSW